MFLDATSNLIRCHTTHLIDCNIATPVFSKSVGGALMHGEMSQAHASSVLYQLCWNVPRYDIVQLLCPGGGG